MGRLRSLHRFRHIQVSVPKKVEKIALMSAGERIASRVQSSAGTMRLRKVREAAHGRMLFALSLPEIVLRLHVHPKFRGSAECSRQPESHISRDARLTVQ
jgi:hypothetical protein